MALELKTKLLKDKDYIETRLSLSKDTTETSVLKLWLKHTNELIDVCVKRNRF